MKTSAEQVRAAENAQPDLPEDYDAFLDACEKALPQPVKPWSHEMKTSAEQVRAAENARPDLPEDDDALWDAIENQRDRLFSMPLHKIMDIADEMPRAGISQAFIDAIDSLAEAMVLAEKDGY